MIAATVSAADVLVNVVPVHRRYRNMHTYAALLVSFLLGFAFLFVLFLKRGFVETVFIYS